MTGLVAVSGLLGLLLGALTPDVVRWALRRARADTAPSATPPRTAAGAALASLPDSGGVTRVGCRAGLAGGTAVLLAAVAARLGPTPALPAFLYLAAVSVPLAITDLDARRLPDRLTLPPYALGAALLTLATAAGPADARHLARAGLGSAAALLRFGLLALAQPRGLGLGDVKLAGLLGLHTAWLGWTTWYISFLAGSLAAAVAALTLLLAGRPRRASLPFGPFLLLGALTAVLLADTGAVTGGH